MTFKNIVALGLEVHTFFQCPEMGVHATKVFKGDRSKDGLCPKCLGAGVFVYASDLEKILEQAPVMKCGIDQSDPTDKKAGWLADQTGTHSVYTHTALLVGIKPIVKDSFEQFVKDMAGHAKFQYTDGKWAMNSEYWIERAKKLLGEEG